MFIPVFQSNRAFESSIWAKKHLVQGLYLILFSAWPPCIFSFKITIGNIVMWYYIYMTSNKTIIALQWPVFWGSSKRHWFVSSAVCFLLALSTPVLFFALDAFWWTKHFPWYDPYIWHLCKKNCKWQGVFCYIYRWIWKSEVIKKLMVHRFIHFRVAMISIFKYFQIKILIMTFLVIQKCNQ